MTYIHSHFGVYALIFNEEKDKVLLIKKARGPYTGMFDLPGGSPEPTELLEETLYREIKEETDCDVTHAVQIGGVSAKFHYRKNSGEEAILRHLGVVYKTEIAGTPKVDADGEDSNGCVWLNICDLNNKNATPFVFEAIRKSA
ncbi:MAG: NUDIX domain-containing protein [Micavibrio sp.]|nr:MAG: NUDIX domain-containing protein [Micavibrio sp.]